MESGHCDDGFVIVQTSFEVLRWMDSIKFGDVCMEGRRDWDEVSRSQAYNRNASPVTCLRLLRTHENRTGKLVTEAVPLLQGAFNFVQRRRQ